MKWLKNGLYVESPTGVIVKTIIIQVLLYADSCIYYNTKSKEAGIEKEKEI